MRILIAMLLLLTGAQAVHAWNALGHLLLSKVCNGRYVGARMHDRGATKLWAPAA